MAGSHPTSRSGPLETRSSSSKGDEKKKKMKSKEEKTSENDKESKKKSREHKSQPLTEFKLFPKLPIELRTSIWRLTLEPRVVAVSCGYLFPARYGHVQGIFTKTPPPTALCVCRDSHQAVISNYPLRFGTAFTIPKIRFNFDIDTLLLDPDMDTHYALFFNGMKTEDLTRVKRLAVCNLSEGNVQRWQVEESGGYVIDRAYIVRTVVPAMESLEKIIDVRAPRCEMGEEPPGGDGQMRLFDILPKGLNEAYGVDFYGNSLAGAAPMNPYSMAGVKVTGVWGWCPTKEWLSHGYVKDWRDEYE